MTRRGPWFDLDRAGTRHGLALAIGLAALLLRLWHLDLQPLWLDEAMTMHIVHAPDGFAQVHNTPPLYYWLLRHWAGWFGIGTAGLRSLSAVAGALFVLATFHTARCVFGNRAAVPAALFALLSPIHLYYSQEARAYSLLLLGLMVATGACWSFAQRVRSATWLVLVVADAASLYTHYLAAIPLVFVHGAAVLTAPPAARRQVAMAMTVALALAAGTLAPWTLWWSRRTSFEPRDMEWLALLWSQLSDAAALASSTELLLLGGQDTQAPIFLKQFTHLHFPGPARIAALTATGCLVMLCLWRLRVAPALRARTTLLCLGLFLGPLFTLLALSHVRPMYCPGRYDLVAFPGLVLFLGAAIAAALDHQRRLARWLGGLLVVLLGTVLAAKDWSYFVAAPDGDPGATVAARLAERVESGDLVVLCGPAGLPVLAHLYQQGFVWADGTCRAADGTRSFGCRLLPPELEAAPGSLTRYVRAREHGRLATDLRHVLPLEPAPGIWLVLDGDVVAGVRDPAGEPVGQRLFRVLEEAGYELAESELEFGIAHFRLRSHR